MKILVIAAHPDDEVLGCGGAISKHTSNGDSVDILFVSDGVNARNSNNPYEVEKRKKAALSAASILGTNQPIFFDYPDNQLDTVPLLHVIQKIESVISELQPDTIYTHHSGDLNIDHEIVNRAVMTASRSYPGQSVKNIFVFEVVSSTECQGLNSNKVFIPNHYVDIDQFLEKKMLAINAYSMEMRDFPHPRSVKAIKSLAAWRGASVGIQNAECFQVIRQIA